MHITVCDWMLLDPMLYVHTIILIRSLLGFECTDHHNDRVGAVSDNGHGHFHYLGNCFTGIFIG